MNILTILQVNFKKLTQRKAKALFLILPITVLMILTVIVSSQVSNFQTAANQSIFGTIESQATLINLVKSLDLNSAGGQGQQRSFFNADNQFTSSDVDKIKQIANVNSVSINSAVPITNAQTTDLFSGKTYRLNNIVELDSGSASLYTQDNFDYTDGGVVPIILNANTFQRQYEDWGGQDSIQVTFSRGRGVRATGNPLANTNSPIKTETISYDKSSLIGKTFTINFGGLNAQQDYKVDQAAGVLTFTKLTQDVIDSNLATEKDAISKYWNYDKLNTPITYTFKVVGIIESTSDNKTYIPQDFADALMNKYIQNQIDARNSTAIPTTVLNTTYRGMTYDGTQLTSANGGRGGFGGGFRSGGQGEAQSASYTIPGLVIDLSNDGQQTVNGVDTDPNVYKNSVKTGQSMSIKINSVYDRGQVVKDLNAAGFAYQDLNNLDVFNSLRDTLNTISTGFTIGFIALAVGVIIFAMSKFVSESRKEIGIFRAIGAKKISIVEMFTMQALLYSFIGFLIGGILGFLLNKVLAGIMSGWFNSLIGETIKKTFNVVNSIDANVFSTISWHTIKYYSVGLLIITFVIALIPALKASSISPVEAIKGE